MNRSHHHTLSLVVLMVVGSLLGGACGERNGGPPGGTQEREPRELAVDFQRETVVQTSKLQFELMGTRRLVADRARVTFLGASGDYAELDTFFAAEVGRRGDVGNLRVELDVGQSLWPELSPADGSVFEGAIVIELYDELGVLGRGRVDGARFDFRTEVAPNVESIESGDVQVNDRLEVSGEGFLRPEEGTTRAIVEDAELTLADGTTASLNNRAVALQWDGRRDRALLPLDPAVFGVQPGRFRAILRFENEFDGGGTIDGSTGHSVEGEIQPTFIARLTPQAGSRGQKITVEGGGFIPNDEEGNYGMFLRYEGQFDPDDPAIDERDYTGERAFERIPDRVTSDEEAEQNIWYEVEDRRLTGLGATPGAFDGTITPVLTGPNGQQTGVSWEGTFRVLPTKQLIYLKYLPAFSKALEKYGLRNVERAIRDRIKEVIRRDYGDWHVGVREEQPDDFVDYATIELGGPDPSGTRAFGYDNSFNGVAKDTGNLFLADYLGGVNADAAAEFNNPYGGIFIESFTFFSPSLSDNPNTAEAFDEILKPFMPRLGGEPVRGTEWPDGPRTDQIRRAVDMVGSVIGNTVTHEIGHSLGMTFVEGDFIRPQNVFHNEIPGPFIMDGGADRPFAERAGLQEEPAEFSAVNKQYLDQILPKP